MGERGRMGYEENVEPPNCPGCDAEYKFPDYWRHKEALERIAKAHAPAKHLQDIARAALEERE